MTQTKSTMVLLLSSEPRAASEIVKLCKLMIKKEGRSGRREEREDRGVLILTKRATVRPRAKRVYKFVARATRTTITKRGVILLYGYKYLSLSVWKTHLPSKKAECKQTAINLSRCFSARLRGQEMLLATNFEGRSTFYRL